MTSTTQSSSTQRSESLAEYAYNELRDRLIVLAIAPGSPINDDQMGKELGVGRTPVREALKRLEVDHLVNVYPRRGTFAATVDITDLAEISEIRARLEPLAAGRAARLSNAGTRAELESLASTLESLQPGDPSQRDVMRYDIQVHRSIYRAAGSRHLEDTLVRYDNLATRIWCLVLDRLPPVSDHVMEHVELLRHIVAGRADEAEKLALHHVTAFERLVRSVL
ncbi:GntR family transcriptional regulator [Cryobacterium psychrophilum]|uniref:GntR family transcriptional regulator n=1 Tax=Cryobacterium psychrophilum TaxID=41988 RepID=A0A4Y8KX30_9MICO|nr:GntR family transcriptional regulator [Cryobacterium psychrophilum]TDW29451.1 DNA-binding GntR family transcriptional regulator [Cryobacterium psychrophilum]TFD81412.1 GntR family transcriptional regulator [Cryobacterium psychrophilum]